MLYYVIWVEAYEEFNDAKNENEQCTGALEAATIYIYIYIYNVDAYIYIYTHTCIGIMGTHTYIYIYIYTWTIRILRLRLRLILIRPIFPLTLSLLSLLDSNFPGNPLRAWEFHPLSFRLCSSQTL